ncbi:MAG: hypothetical protein PF484_03765 [Bacteroidales bacterium]|jgi:hypothetical protein|nr:hypothetical protein [Bacteroidales bacterium]
MIKENKITNNLSKHLFWDIDSSALDLSKHSKYIITRVLQYGLYSDWEKLLAYYGLETIVHTAMKIKGLDKKTASFLAVLGNTQKKNFLCYTTEQSTPKHWNF